MKTVVLIPAYNEENTIRKVAQGIPRDFCEEVEILVVDDGSSDRTVEEAKAGGAEHVVSHRRNQGLGKAFATGMEAALEVGANLIVTIDADGQFNSQDIPRLVAPVLSGKADMVTCSRFAKKEWMPEMPGIKRWGNKRFTNLINRVTGQNFTDTQCGFRVYSREAAMHLNLFGSHTYTQEVFLQLAWKGFRIVEVPCKLAKDQREGESRVVHNVRRYSVRSLFMVFTTYRDFQPLRFFGGIGAALFIPGTIVAGLLLLRLVLFNMIFPFLSLAYVSVFMMGVGVVLFVMALLADMYMRQRLLMEEVLYRLRKSEYE